MTRFTSDLGLRYGATALAAAGLLATAACSSSGSKPSTSNTTSKSSTSSSSSSSTASSAPAKTPSQQQLSFDLIGGDSIPGDTFKLHDTQPLSQGGATGIIGSFANADATRTVSDILVYFPTAAAAATATSAGEGAVSGEITKGLKDAAAPGVGSLGHLYQGQTDQGEATLLLFQEGNYLCTIEFDSKAGDPIPAALATQVGQAQDSKLKAAS